MNGEVTLNGHWWEIRWYQTNKCHSNSVFTVWSIMADQFPLESCQHSCMLYYITICFVSMAASDSLCYVWESAVWLLTVLFSFVSQDSRLWLNVQQVWGRITVWTPDESYFCSYPRFVLILFVPHSGIHRYFLIFALFLGKRRLRALLLA